MAVELKSCLVGKRGRLPAINNVPVCNKAVLYTCTAKKKAFFGGTQHPFMQPNASKSLSFRPLLSAIILKPVSCRWKRIARSL